MNKSQWKSPHQHNNTLTPLAAASNSRLWDEGYSVRSALSSSSRGSSRLGCKSCAVLVTPLTLRAALWRYPWKISSLAALQARSEWWPEGTCWCRVLVAKHEFHHSRKMKMMLRCCFASSERTKMEEIRLFGTGRRATLGNPRISDRRNSNLKYIWDTHAKICEMNCAESIPGDCGVFWRL